VSPSQQIFSPELEEILRDVARMPDSVLLRAPRSKPTAKLFDVLGPASPMAAGLSSAERELLRAHRDELASVLRDACWMATQEVGRRESCLDRRNGLGGIQRVHSQAAIQARAEGALSTASGQVEHILARLVSANGFSKPSVAELATASHRIQPTDHARICAALDLIWRGQPEASVELSLEVAQHGTLLADRIASWRNAATAYEMAGDLRRALALAVTASQLASDYAYPALHAFALAIHAQQSREALYAASLIDTLSADFTPGLVAFALDLESRRTRGRWRPPAHSLPFIASIEHHIGPNSQRILRAFR
jgi:hypothetical protein